MSIKDTMREKIRSFLQIEPASSTSVMIRETFSYEGEAAKNRIWYRGDANEISQLYKSVDGGAERSMFWSAVPSQGRTIRKLHTGLPGMMIDVITSIVMADLNDIKADSTFEEMMKDAKFSKNLLDEIEEAVKECLICGDGAFKITCDSTISKYPVVEFVPGDRIEYSFTRGMITDVTFKTDVKHKDKKYSIYERYGYGYIKTELLKDDRTEVLLDTIPETSGIIPEITFDDSFMMAIPMRINRSHKWKGRGESIISRKSDSFDSFDEVWSQWMEAIRLGRAKEYVPESMLPRNPETGETIKPNAFDNAYIARESPMIQGAYDKIDLIQPDIPTEKYMQTYITALDMCLQGIISPSTLGIDTKKLDNAEAQREKEKTTLYTRNKVIDSLNNVIPELVNAILRTFALMNNQPFKNVDVTVSFGEYANPSFESQIETIGKGKTAGVMSIEAAVEELYGDSKDDDWKQEEIRRIKEEQGIAQVEELTINDLDV